MGYGPTVAGTIRVNYEKYLYPYEIFLAKNGKMDVCVYVCVCDGGGGTIVKGTRVAITSTVAFEYDHFSHTNCRQCVKYQVRACQLTLSLSLSPSLFSPPLSPSLSPPLSPSLFPPLSLPLSLPPSLCPSVEVLSEEGDIALREQAKSC